MATTTVSSTTVPATPVAATTVSKTVVPTSFPFYKNPAFYMIVIAIIILIIVGFIVYFQLNSSGGPGLSITVVSLYAFAIILLVIGVIWAIV